MSIRDKMKERLSTLTFDLYDEEEDTVIGGLCLHDEGMDKIIDAILSLTTEIAILPRASWMYRKSWDNYTCSNCSYESETPREICPRCNAVMGGIKKV